MRILSIHQGHDASLCVYSDGEIETFLLSERFSKIKYDSSIPLKFLIPKILSKNINLTLNTNFRKDHHIHHAAIAFYNSGFEESIVIVADGLGASIEVQSGLETVYPTELETVYFSKYPDIFVPLYKNMAIGDLDLDLIVNKFYDTEVFQRDQNQKYLNFIETVKNYFNKDDEYYFDVVKELKKKFNCELSLGHRLSTSVAYLDATLKHCHFDNAINDAGKTMGLSSYGEKISNFPKIFEKNILKKPAGCDYPLNCVYKLTKENYKPIADYCYEMQIQTQEAMCHLIEKALSKNECRNVCISGGYGMNIVANHYYTQQFPDVNFYFEPLSDDGGQSIGQAMLHYRRQTKDKNIYPLQTTSIHGYKYDVHKYLGMGSSIKEIAKILFNNKSVAVYSGLAESGKRALGNRSILFNALNPDAKDIVNKIKKREWYRPFAAMVLEEDASLYFDMGKVERSPFMTICFPVKTDIIPGVTHVDNTCRIQTVSKLNGYLYELLLEFKKLSGHGVLLNTSFNLAGETLVETPKDAFKTLNNSCLDYLWFEETHQLFYT